MIGGRFLTCPRIHRSCQVFQLKYQSDPNRSRTSASSKPPNRWIASPRECPCSDVTRRPGHLLSAPYRGLGARALDGVIVEDRTIFTPRYLARPERFSL